MVLVVPALRPGFDPTAIVGQRNALAEPTEIRPCPRKRLSPLAKTIPNCATRSAGSAPATPAPTGAPSRSKEAYPTEFVNELTQAGFLGALIPEEYGGSGLPLRAAAVILEEINASGCVASQGHAQMYIMGTLLRHGSEAQKRKYLPDIAAGRIRLQAFGVTEPTTGSDTTQLKTRAVRDGDSYVITGQKVWTVARHALRHDAAAGAHHVGRSGEEAQRRAVGVPDRHDSEEHRARAWRSARSRR